MNNEERITLIRQRLQQEFAPVELEINDDSHLHANHSGHGGAGHFRVTIVSDKFEQHTQVACHQMIYAALADLMRSEIHALSINAKAPNK